MAKHRVWKVVEAGEVEVPDACPKCGAEFKGANSMLVEWDLHDVGGYVDLDTGDCRCGMDKDGDDYHPTAFWCGACSKWNV